MSKEFDQLNEKYNDDTYPIFPFIAKDRITVLQKGFYRKNKAKFRGVTAIYNNETKEYEYPLYGMYHIKENLVIVPPEMEMTERKQKLLEAQLTAGYKQVDSAPKFETYKFPPDSEEAKLALFNKAEYQNTMTEDANTENY